MQVAAWIALASLVSLGGCDDRDVDDFEPIAAAVDRCFVRTHLVSNVDGLAPRIDRALINAWSVTPALDVFTVVSAHAGSLTAYNADGSAPFGDLPGVQRIGGGYTGSVLAGSLLYLASDDGLLSLIDMEHDPLRLYEMVDRGAEGALYTGIAAIDELLLVADAHNGRVDVFDAAFRPLASPTFAGPAGFAPFNIAVLDGIVFITYAQGGRGALVAFSRDGVPLWTSGGEAFAAPWGMAIAPAGFGDLAGALLVANHDDGTIAVVDRANGDVLARVSDDAGRPFIIDGLWALTTGVGVRTARPDAIYFTAGPAGGSHGLFGVITPCD
jgi:uncharacterized protein (TIGR03118 family)